MNEGWLSPPPEMLAAARARGDGLLVWVRDNTVAQLVHVRERTAIRWPYNSTQVDEFELPTVLPTLAAGTRAFVGHRQHIELTVA